MNTIRNIFCCLVLLAFVSCANKMGRVSAETMEQAQSEYKSGFECLQADDLNEAFPHFLNAASLTEMLPEDMDDEQTLFVSRAYYQMGYVFGGTMENDLEVEAYKRACDYQEAVHDTVWLMRTWEQLVGALQSMMENDSAQYYLDKLVPLVDSVADFDTYLRVCRLVSNQYYDQKQYDAAFAEESRIIAMKAHRGLDTKRDSLSLGINMFFSPMKKASKPYLLKVLDVYADTITLESGAVMSLLSQLYEEEGNADSVAFCNRFLPKYAQAESERVSDGILLAKQYAQFKAERDARLDVLREQKATRKKTTFWLCSGLALLLLAVVIAAIVKRKRKHQASYAAGWAQFEKSDIFVRIRERLAADAPKISSKNVEDFPQLALSQADFGALKDAVDAAFGGFASRLAANHPDLSPADINACCLALMGLSHAEMAVLQGVKYNSFTNRITKIKKVLGTDEGLSDYLKHLLKE